jgi:hypothetical protein
VVGRDGLEGPDHLQLLVAHRLRLEARGGLHGDEAEELHQVVLHHVAHGAGAVVVGPAALDPHRLGHGDLDVVDVVVVPQGLEEEVAEADGHEVLDRSFPR